jgi:putative FmdB family regulatory protein
MPIYDYHCNDCHIEKEKLAPSTLTTIECPECGGKMVRIISGAQSFYFKGQGASCEKSMSKTAGRTKR